MTVSHDVSICLLTPDSPSLPVAAQWRHDMWLKDDGYTLDDSLEQLRAVARGDRLREADVIAIAGNETAGICLLVEEELEPLHDVSPWLASLFVAPAFRRQGIARRLIAAIEDQARMKGVDKLYLYTVDAESLYVKCGWQVLDRVIEHGRPLALLMKHLHDPPASCGGSGATA